MQTILTTYSKPPQLPDLQKLRLEGDCYVPFDQWTKQDLAQWIEKHVPFKDRERTAKRMKRQSEALINLWPNALQVLDWETIHFLAMAE